MKFNYLQKPYACQLPGCIKRYTDPSSLRKHVKNHALRDSGQGRRKSHRAASVTSKGIKKSRRRFSESSAYSSVVSQEPNTPATPLTPHIEYFSFDNVFADPIDSQKPHQSETYVKLYDDDVMNFNEWSTCLSTMGQETTSSETTTIESIKKYLCQSDSDYTNEISQSNIDLNYFC